MLAVPTTMKKAVQAVIRMGNKKLPTSTYIYNSCSAHDCPSPALGLCQICPNGKPGAPCYAYNAEVQHPAVLPFRRRQGEFWKTIHPKHFAMALLRISEDSRSRKMTAFRYNEAGDFISQKQLSWFATVCQYLQENGVSCYGYTARTDLNLTRLLRYSSVQVSNDKRSFVDKGANRFLMVPEATGNNPVCPGSCKTCTLCQKARNTTIEVVKH